MLKISSPRTMVTMVIATICWGLSFVAIKVSLEAFSPLAVVTIRLFFVVIILGTLFWCTYGARGIPKRRDFPKFLFIGLLNPFLAFLLESTSMLYISASLASVIMSTVPLVTPVAAFFIIRERVSIFNIVGLVCSFAGVCCIVLDRGVEPQYTALGLVLMTAAMLSAVLYTIFAKQLLNSYASLTVVTFQQVFGFLLYLPLFFIMEADAVFSPGGFEMMSFLSIVFLAVFPSSLAYYFFNDGIKRVGPVKANAYMNLTPVITAIAALFLLDEHFGWLKGIGIMVSVTGLFLAQVKRRGASV
jgi:drug/metabolite transporter (DMT)-like permease